MPTIESIGSVGCDYTTPQAWYDAHKGDITSDPAAPYIGEMEAETFSTALDMSGSTTDATHYFHLRAKAGSKFDGDFDGSYPCIDNEASGDFVSVADDYTRLEGFVVGKSSVLLETVISGFKISGDNCLLDTVGVYDISTVLAFFGAVAATGIMVDGGTGTVIRNCACGDLYSQNTFGSGTATARGIQAVNGAELRAYNNAIHSITAVGPSGAGSVGILTNTTGSVVLINNVVGLLTGTSSTGGIGTYGTGSKDVQYNATTDTTGGTNSQDNITPADEFVDSATATLDLHIKPSGQCRGNGLNLIASGYPDAPTEDCDGQARSTTDSWDIGIDHYFPLVSCTWSFSALAGSHLPIGVDQPPGTGSNYPFVRPVNDEEKVVGDLFLRHIDDDCSLQLPFTVKWLYRFGCAPGIVPEGIVDRGIEEMLIVDANDTTVFDTRATDTFVRMKWGPNAWVLQWMEQEDSAAGSRKVKVLRVVRYLLEDEDDFAYPIYQELENGLLDGRAIAQSSPRVTSISKGLLAFGAGAGSDTPRAIFKGGYNTEITEEVTEEVDGGERTTTLTFDMSPGLGLGRYEVNCDDIANFGIKRINTIEPTAYQDFGITSEENSCTRVQRPWHELITSPQIGCRSAKIRNAAIQIDGDCPPCCTCDDFIGVYESVRSLTTVLKDYWERAHAIRDWLQSSIDRMDQQRECRASHRLRAYAQSECPDNVACSIAYCNSTQECVKNVLLPISFNYTDSLDSDLVVVTKYRGNASPAELCGYTKRAGNVSDQYLYQLAVPYVLGGTYPHFWVYFDAIEPYSMGFVTFFINFPKSKRGDTAKFIVDAYSLPEAPVVQSQEESLPYLTDYDYTIGSGPDSALAQCLAWRLVDSPVPAGAGILQEPCCIDNLSDF